MLNLKKNLRLVKAQKREPAENCSHKLGKALGEGLGHKFS